MRLPLQGVRVLDLSHHVSGPLCARFLADFGAEVIKVERPGGDPGRYLPPHAGDDPHPEKSGYFHFLNLNKKGVTIDFRTPAGAALVRDLVRRADVLVENWPPGFLDQLGLGYAALRALQPRLVMTSITPFGQTGPYRRYEATGLVVLAMGGLAYITGDPDREPLAIAGHQAEAQGALYGWIGTLAALLERRRTGSGRHVDVSLFEAVASNLEYTISMYSFAGLVRGRWHSRLLNAYPADIYPCKDGWVVVILAPRPIEYLAALMEDPRLLDPRFVDTAGRLRHAEEFDAIVTEWTTRHTRDEILRLAQEKLLNFAPVSSPADLVGNPQFQARGYFRSVRHPLTGEVLMPGLPLAMEASPWAYRYPAPLLGQHTADVLQELLGCSPEDLAHLRRTGVI